MIPEGYPEIFTMVKQYFENVTLCTVQCPSSVGNKVCEQHDPCSGIDHVNNVIRVREQLFHNRAMLTK